MCEDEHHMEVDENLEDEDIADLTKKLDHFLSAFIFSSGSSFRLVENKYLREFIDLLSKVNFTYKPMTRQTLARKCLYTVHEKICEQKKKLLAGTKSVLLADGWKNSVANKKYLVFGLSNKYLPMTFLMFRDVSLEREDGQSLTENFNAAIEYAKNVYDTEVYAIVTDNDSKIVCGGREATNQEGQKSMTTTCFSHSANLLMKSLVPEKFVKEMREISKTFRDPKLQCFVKLLGGTKIKSLSDTRFGYIRDTIECLIKNIEFFRRAADDDDLIEKISAEVLQNLFDPSFEKKMRDTYKLLTPICAFMNKCQNPRYTIAEAAQYWLELKLPTEECDDEEKANINIIFMQRTSKALKDAMLAANLLHHKYQGSLLNDLQKQKAELFLDSCLNGKEKEELAKFRRNKDDFAELYSNCGDAREFWSWCSLTLPYLSKFAINLLSIPASTAQLEGIFSQWKFIHTDYKGNMHDDTSGYLIDIYHTLKFMDFEDGHLLDLIKRCPRQHLEL